MFESTLLVDPADQFADLVAAINAVPARAARGGTAVDCDLRVRSLLILARRIDALLLSEIAAFDDQGFAPALGAKSTGAYLAAHGHLDPAAARRMVIAARTADRLPQLGAMLAAGDIATDHVTAVGFATRRLPQDVVTAEDATFSSLAASARPSELRIAGAHLQAMYDTDATARDARHLRDSRYLTLGQTLHGAWHLEGMLTPEDGLALSLALDALSAKTGAEDDRSITQRRADALIELATLAMRSGELPDTGGDQPRVTLLLQAKENPFTHHRDLTLADDWDLEPDGDHELSGDTAKIACDGEPSATLTGGDSRLLAPTSGLTTPADGLLTPTGGFPDLTDPVTRSSGAGFSLTGFDLTDVELLGATALISQETLQRICCDAEFNLATLDATANLVNLGRSSRFPNLTQRRAVKLRDKHCVFPGCDTPPHRCLIHHIDYWADGGGTDLCNLALICRFHHYLIHDQHWKLAPAPPTAEHPTGSWTATAPDGHQLRQTRKHAA